ncbi:Ig-like domain repeat protein, partial [Streptomyces sp. BR123]|uniref:Ig-like domain repeat protein n=1 Tax=Streptomyces sp. BR123 TaxID=2749828 RepID=UPI001C4FAC62
GDGSPAETVALVGGVATATHAYASTAGSPYGVTAVYSGDSDFQASTGTDTHTVNIALTTTTVTSAPDPSLTGEQVTATATVTANAPGAGTPTGIVTFDFGDGAAPVPAVVVGGTATATHTYATTAGSPYTITAAYGGDSNYSGSSGTDPHVVTAADTTTTLTALPDPSAVGDSVTATATVTANAPGAGTPTGTVTFDFGDGTTVDATLVGGVATTGHTYTTTAGSPYTITATYQANGDYTSSTATETQTVTPNPTTLTVTSAPDPSVVGQQVTVTASVTAPAGAGTPTGNVAFDFGDGTPTVTAAVVGGVATTEHTYSTAAGSPYTITATYEGDIDFTGSVGTDLHTVEPGTATVLVTSAADPSVVGEPVTVNATVVPDIPGAPVATGTVVFDFGDASLPVTASLIDGSAEVSHTYTDTAGSPYTITATYSGDVNLSAALGVDTQTVQPTATTVTVTSAPDPSLVGQEVTITAVVTSAQPGAVTPTGWVVFEFGDGLTNAAPLVDGVATISYLYSSADGSPYTITATYAGDLNHVGAAGTDTQTVEPAPTTLSLASGPDPSTEGEPVTFTALVTSDIPGAGTPTGAVLFDFGNGDTASATLTGGLATLTYAYPSAVGSPFTISATYSGDGDFLGASATDTQEVNAAGL